MNFESLWCRIGLLFLVVGLSVLMSWNNEVLAGDTDLGSRSVTGKLSPEETQVADAAAWFGTGMVLQMEGKVSEAMEAFARSALIDPTNLILVEQVVPYLLSVKRNDEAISILERALDFDSDNENLRSLLGMTYIASNRLNESLKLNLDILEKNPGAVAALRSVLLIYYQEGQDDKVPDLVERTLGQAQLGPSGWIQVASVLSQFLKSSQGDAALLSNWIRESVSKALTSDGADDTTKSMAGQLYEEVGDRDQAIKCYEELLALPVVPASIRTRLAFLYLQIRENQKAEKLALEIMDKEPLNPFGYRISGYLAQDAENFIQAASYFEKAIRHAPNFEPVYYDLFTAYLNAKQIQEARQTLGKVSFRFKPSFQLFYYEGLLDSREENYSKAIESYLKAEQVAVEEEPERLTAVFYFQIGVASEREKQLENAEKYFKKCMEIDPEFAEAMNYLGYTWADNGIRLEEALELIESAVALEPDNPAFLDSLGWVHYRLNSFQEALKFQLKAIEFSSSPDPVMFDHLGDIHLKMDNIPQAREAYKKALSLDEENEISAEVTRKLESIAE